MTLKTLNVSSSLDAAADCQLTFKTPPTNLVSHLSVRLLLIFKPLLPHTLLVSSQAQLELSATCKVQMVHPASTDTCYGAH